MIVKKKICSLCVKHHKERGEIPACFFPKSVKKTYDRSIKHFIEINK